MAATTTINPYVTLGVPPGASRAEVARAHRRMAKEFHPDVHPGPEAAERMRRINEAWRILSNPVRRAQYDAERSAMTRVSDPWHGSGSAYRSRTGTATWTTWPDDRQSTGQRMERPARPDPVERSFGDRPVVLVAVWMLLGVLYFVGSWLGSMAP
jgi:molecular chaperone DnaJ